MRLFEHFDEFEDKTALQNIPNPYLHINFDDTVAQKGVHDSETLNEFAYYGRHFCISTWINSQHGHALNPGKDAARAMDSTCKCALFVGDGLIL